MDSANEKRLLERIRLQSDSIIIYSPTLNLLMLLTNGFIKAL